MVKGRPHSETTCSKLQLCHFPFLLISTWKLFPFLLRIIICNLHLQFFCIPAYVSFAKVLSIMMHFFSYNTEDEVYGDHIYNLVLFYLCCAFKHCHPILGLWFTLVSVLHTFFFCGPTPRNPVVCLLHQLFMLYRTHLSL